MKSNISVSLIFLLVFLFISCDKENEKDDNIIYPLAVGNVWEYSRDFNLYYYSDSLESPQYYDTTTYSSDVSVVVTKKTVFFDTLETYELISTENQGTNTYIQTGYYNNEKDGLYEYAYIFGGGAHGLVKLRLGNTIRFKDLTFNSFYELSEYLQLITPIHKIKYNSVHFGEPRSIIISDSIYFEDPPLKTLQYPLEIGNQWTYRKSGDPWRIDKKVNNMENIIVPAGEFSCFTIQWLYDLDADGAWG